MSRPNCYNCKYRVEVPGSAHSCCTVLRKEGDENNPETMMIEIGLSIREIALVNESDQKPIVKLDEHGVKNGWADWPLNFDPVWVDECPFETAKV